MAICIIILRLGRLWGPEVVFRQPEYAHFHLPIEWHNYYLRLGQLWDLGVVFRQSEYVHSDLPI